MKNESENVSLATEETAATVSEVTPETEIPTDADAETPLAEAQREEERLFEDHTVVGDDRIFFFEVEEDDSFVYEEMDEDTKKDVEAANAAFEVSLKNDLKSKAIIQPCTCGELQTLVHAIQHSESEEQMNLYGQEMLDNYTYGVIVRTNHGRDLDVLMEMRQCRICGKLEFWGDMRPLLKLMADGYSENLHMLHMTNTIEPEGDPADEPISEEEAEKVEAEIVKEEEKPKSNVIPMGYVLENVETGERTEADSLAKALFGKNAKDDAIKMEDIDKDK